MTDVDSLTLDPDAEGVVQTPPTQPLWSENFLFALYDEAQKIGLWLHLGTVPTDWYLWEDRVYLSLPDGGVLSMMGYHATAAKQRPAGSVMRFTCIEMGLRGTRAKGPWSKVASRAFVADSRSNWK